MSVEGGSGSSLEMRGGSCGCSSCNLSRETNRGIEAATVYRSRACSVYCKQVISAHLQRRKEREPIDQPLTDTLFLAHQNDDLDNLRCHVYFSWRILEPSRGDVMKCDVHIV